MKVVFTAAALSDLKEILIYTSQHYPSSIAPLESRIRAVIAHIQRWPQSTRLVEERRAVRVIPLTRYPFKIFYRVRNDRLEILHIHHSARKLFEL